MEKLDDIMEGPPPPPIIIRNKISHYWWKYTCVILLAICMVLECIINMALTSRYQDSKIVTTKLNIMDKVMYLVNMYLKCYFWSLL